ncbi:MAG: ribonuclease III [Acidimicrobiia bacterium]|nr:ribonuclease III [Acidimicrobiia bacterium]
MADAPTPLEAALGYTFTDRGLLRRALTHRSHDPDGSNERLEFLGDAVLEFVITTHLYASSERNEGEMTKVRISVVSQEALSEIARVAGVGEAVLLDPGEEETGGRRKPSILSDALEAVLGAIYLDAGLEAVRAVVLARWAPLLAEMSEAPGDRDSKSRLQETLARSGLVPSYSCQGEGPDHAREFFATVGAGGRTLGSGSGTSKKAAEQAAARRALDLLAAEEAADA